MKIPTLKIHPDAKIPTRAHQNDAGLDVYCFEEIALKPGERKSIRTGIAMEIPDGYVGLIWEKSGLSHRFGLKLFGGVIDSEYRGEIQIGVMNLSQESFVFEKGHKIAQILIQKVEMAECIEAQTLSESVRGTNGFGSSGK